MPKFRGTVKSFDKEKGTGFITLDNVKSTVFVHNSAIHDDDVNVLTEGQNVQFEIIVTTRWGPAAVKVRNVTKGSKL